MRVVCAACGTEQSADARFCSSCGASLRRPCPSCGTEVLADAAFCSACGIALGEGVRRAGATDEREERRLASILFADLANSTAFGSSADPEDVRELQAGFAALVEREVTRYGGILEKFVGDAVLAVFGVPQAHEDDAERAVLAALALRDAFPAFAHDAADRHGGEVGLRVGVNTGEVVSGRTAAARGELMVSGDAVNVAARLEQHAEPGTVLVGGRTRAAAAGAIAFRRREPIRAKGKDAPVEAWIAIAPRAEPRRRGLGDLDAPLVGRAEELAVLQALAARVARERVPQLVTLFGPAGVGKSRLLDEFVDRLPGARLLRGRCVPYGEGITYRPLADVAKDHAGILESDPAPDALEKLGRAVRSVVPPAAAEEIAEALALTIGLVTTDVAGDRRPWLHDAWTRYVAALGADRLTVIAIEDIHWASEPLLDALDHLAEALADTAVLLVCPARPELLEGRRTWGAGRQNAISLTIPPLRPADTASLVESLLGAAVPGEVVETVLARAEGNPFFVEELLRMLIERGALERRNGGWRATAAAADVPIPDSVHGVLAARLDLLDAEVREALLRCAVVGRVFWPDAVAVDADAVEALARRGLVVERPRSAMAGLREFTFKHALTQEVAYGTLPRSERRSLHRRVGEWIASVAPDRAVETAELAAYHLTEAIAYGDDDPALRDRALTLLLRAAEAALGRGLAGSAEQLYARAAELADDVERVRALLGQGRALLADSRIDEGIGVLDAALAAAEHAGDGALVGDVLGWLSRASWLSGEWSRARRTADEAVAALEPLGESPQLARALARRSQVLMLRDDPDAVAAAERALEVARRVEDGFAEANARINLATARASQGADADAAETRDVVSLALRAGVPDEAYRAIVNWLWTAQASDPLPAVASELADLQRALEHVPYLEAFESYLSFSIARHLHVPMGAWGELDAILEQTPVGAGSRLVWLDLTSGMALRRGELARAGELLAEYRPEALASGETQRIQPMFCVAIPHAALVGDDGALEELTVSLLDLAPQWGTRFPLHPVAPALAASRPDLLRRVDAALRSLPDERRVRHLGVAAALAAALVELDDGEAMRAARRLATLVARHRALGRAYEAACLELALARALEAAGRAEEAAATGEHARAFLDALGCVNAY